jgi:alkaline phosphatase D
VNVNRPPLYHPNTEGTILGEDQWLWLEKELSGSTADIHLIGSSIQLIPNDHGYEKWGNFPAERQRFFDLMAKTAPSRPIILSGDRHIAEFSKIDLEGLAFPLYEFTSSGLTHTWSSGEGEKNTCRVGELIISKNFGIIEIEHNEDNSIVNITLKIIDDNNKVLEQTQLAY